MKMKEEQSVHNEKTEASNNQPAAMNLVNIAKIIGGDNAVSDSAPREFEDRICAICGGAAHVPFQPHEGKPVYCSDCFKKLNQ